MVILDNAQAHNTMKVKEFSKVMHLMYLPPYSPPLNAIESCFNVIKRKVYSKKYEYK